MSSRELLSNEENGLEEDITHLIFCLRDAAFFNDVETLKLLDSPIWGIFRTEWGCNLLHIAIRRQNDEVFDYLLSLRDFPVDDVDSFGCTALQIAVEQYSCKIECKIYERYILELLKSGADINVIRPGGDPICDYALRKSFPLRLVQSLIEGGADVNIRNEVGFTPLLMCLTAVRFEHRSARVMNETIAMLLFYGADPSITYDNDIDPEVIMGMTDFDYCLRYCCNMTVDDMNVVLENLFFLTVDELSSHKFFGDDLLFLSEYHDSHLFHQAIKYTSGIIFDKVGYDLNLCNLFTMDLEYLRIIVENSPHVVKEYLQNYDPSAVSTKYFDLNRFETLIHSSVSSDAIEFISRLNACGHMVLIPNIEDINELMEAIYYFLSYGAVLYQRDLDFIYERTGYTEDFKNLLFMDIHKDGSDLCDSELFIPAMMPRLIYDVTLDIHKIVENPRQCEFINWDRIFDYFVHPKIQNAYHQFMPNEATKKQLPRVPLLQELARDSFRKYFLQVFKITTPRQFYDLVKLIPNRIVQKIICYESRLY